MKQHRKKKQNTQKHLRGHYWGAIKNEGPTNKNGRHHPAGLKCERGGNEIEKHTNVNRISQYDPPFFTTRKR